MKKIKRILILCTLSLMIGTVPISSVVAQAATTINVDEEASVYSTDVIEKKVRLYNGKLQYRHWNATKGCWVEPDWIDV